jgi:hypothetical protein
MAKKMNKKITELEDIVVEDGLKYSSFSVKHLLIFVIALLAVTSYALFKSYAAPNPNLLGDINYDNTVNVVDLSVLLANYNTNSSIADIDNNGLVNVVDLSTLLSNYGKSDQSPLSSGEESIVAYTTAYTYYDNTPPGSATISDPVIHQKAGGTGTYDDPITLAVGHSITNHKDTLDYPAGTKFYIPNVRRYFIVEDTCGDGSTPQNGPCHTGYPAGTTAWVDMWIDGQTGTKQAVNSCASKVTDGNGESHIIIKNPTSNYLVIPESIFSSGVCTKLYGNTPLKQ